MKASLALILAVIVLAPLCLLIWLGVRLANDEQERVEERFRGVFESRLADVVGELDPVVRKVEGELLDLLDVAPDLPVEGLRSMAREERFVRQVFIVDDSGRLIYPDLERPETGREAAFARRTASVWDDGLLSAPDGEGGAERAHGWQTWFWGSGVQFLFWSVAEDARIYGIEVERAALLSELVNALPDSGNSADSPWIALVDPTGETIYGWGGDEPGTGVVPAAERTLSEPFLGWHMRAYAPALLGAADGVPTSSLFNIVAGVVLGALVLVALGVYFYRAHALEMREAGQRVNFVNQVSHELKTPLTNIRLYAEMLEREIPEGDERARSCLEVVVEESGRLGRLINNVLTFAKKEQRGGTKIQMREGVVDEVVKSALGHFAPAFQGQGVEIEFEGEASRVARFDPDLLEQVLVNLFGNVEKYASSGKKMEVVTSQTETGCEVAVTDRGPGISRSDRNRIFKPFVRLSESVTEGVSGTGIGLTIARDLARDHGGDLVYEIPKGGGARFVVTLEFGK